MQSKRISKAVLLMMAVALQLWSSVANAHVKWFVDEHAEYYNLDSESFSFSERSVVVWSALLITVLVIARVLERILVKYSRTSHLKLYKWGVRHWSILYRAFQILVGMPLIMSAYKGAVIAPHLVGSGLLIDSLRAIEACAGIFLVCNVYATAASWLLVALAAGVFSAFGTVSLLENVGVLGLALFLRCGDEQKDSYGTHEREWKIFVLRILVGMNFVVLALTEKLLRPDLALSFLQHYDLNFMKGVWIDYSDRLFVFSAGIVELAFGLVFILGYVTRLNSFFLLLFLIASNSYFFAVGNDSMAWMEATGHSPILASVLILLIFGRGLSNRTAFTRYMHVKWMFLALSGYRRRDQEKSVSDIGRSPQPNY